MKIAVPYLEGQVFPHFGKAAQFKIYTTADDEIISSEIIETPGSGHAVLADFLAEQKINVLLCGGIGVSAVSALQTMGIQILGGADGEADERVGEFLGGKLHFSTSGSCASCSSACGIRGSKTQPDGEEEECDGNVSACGTWCH